MKRGRYHFRVQAATGPDRVTLRARVWAEGSAEPGVWQAEAYDESGTRLTAGAVGVRTYGPGSKYFDDLVVEPLPSYTTTTRVITYTYDPLYRLTDADYSSGEAFAYAYDAVGNRTVHTRTLTATTVITYAYECEASLKRSKRDAANRLVNVDGVGYTWDANPLRYAARTSPPRSARGLRGNLLSDGVCTFTYEYEASLKQSERGAANRLTSVTSGTLTTTFEYDAMGNRVAQTRRSNC